MISKIVSFKQIPFKTADDKKIPVKYTIPVKDDGDLFVRTYPEYDGVNFVTSVDDKYLNNVAKNKFGINTKNKILSNGGMNVTNKSFKNKGLGVVMHLNSIMQLFENDLEKIELTSLGEAVLFHGKCKFEPKLRDIDEILNAMYTISQKDCAKYPELKEVTEAAGKFFDETFITGGVNCLNTDKMKLANEITKNYIEIMNTKKLTKEEREEYGFDNGFDMVLTKEKILENKDFFNGLFKKFEIDYEL